MRVCDWIAQYLMSIGVERVHGLMGGGAAGLNDGFIKQGMPYICYHHEQGAGHAAIGESKYTGKLAVVNPTTGCAGTNCATSVLNAWQDSVPVLFISGNVKLSTCSGWINSQRPGLKIRKYGIQEHHIVDTYSSMTKYSKFITDVNDVAYELSYAIHCATTGRPGPVWIDIPGDIQLATMKDVKLYTPLANQPPPVRWLTSVQNRISQSQRPLVLAGYGIRQANCVKEFVEFIETYNIPFVSTYGARDYTANDHPLSIGAVGQRGSRAGNFAMQNADCLILLGTSLGASVVGYDPKQFSPHSYKIAIDVDHHELHKNIVDIDEAHHLSLPNFFKAML